MATISGNTVVYCRGAGLALAGGNSNYVSGPEYTTTYAIVQSNNFSFNTFQGIQADVQSSLLSMYVSQVVVQYNVCDGNGHSGIYAVRVFGWTITNNTCNNNHNNGIDIEISHGITVSQNTCSDTRSGSSRTQSCGIYTNSQLTNSDGTHEITITNNACGNNINIGIGVYSLSGCRMNNVQVSGNLLEQNGSYGLVIAPAAASSILNLTLANNTLIQNVLYDSM